MSYWIYSILLMIANLTVLPQLPTNLMNTLQEENVEIRLGEDFVIQKGETAIYNHEIRLTLMDIKDSRCPKGMNCFRAGELLVVLFVEQEASNQSITFFLNGGGSVKKGGSNKQSLQQGWC